MDRWDPDVSVPADEALSLLAGVGHDFREKLSLGAFYRRATTAADPATAEQSVSLQAQIGS